MFAGENFFVSLSIHEILGMSKTEYIIGKNNWIVYFLIKFFEYSDSLVADSESADHSGRGV